MDQQKEDFGTKKLWARAKARDQVEDQDSEQVAQEVVVKRKLEASQKFGLLVLRQVLEMQNFQSFVWAPKFWDCEAEYEINSKGLLVGLNQKESGRLLDSELARGETIQSGKAAGTGDGKRLSDAHFN